MKMKTNRSIAPRSSIGRRSLESLEPRRLFSTATETPFLGTPFAPNQTILAVNYDNGGEAVAFHDTTPANLGGVNYRPGDGVDIQAGGSTGKSIGYVAAGEWLNYSVNIPTAGKFVLQASVANLQSGGTFHAAVNGINLTGAIGIPATGGWQTFTTVTSAAFSLSAGTQVLHIALDKAAANGAVGNLDWFKLVPASSTTFPAQLQWTRLADAPLARIEANAEQVGGKIYVFGGYNITSPTYIAAREVDVYNLATNTWSRAADMPEGITHLGTATDGRYIYTAGGYVTNYATGQQTHASTHVWRYDPVANKWSAFVPLPQARGSGAMVLLGTVLHYFDGYDSSMIARGDHWMLDLSSANPQWVASASVPAPRSHVTGATVNGKIYVIGGEPGLVEGQPTTDVFMWDPAKPSAWQRVASLPVARTTAVSVGINGKLIVTGGLTYNYTPLASVVVYDPTTNTWKQVSDSLPAPRERPAAALINGRLFITTGYANGLHTETWITQPLG